MVELDAEFGWAIVGFGHTSESLRVVKAWCDVSGLGWQSEERPDGRVGFPFTLMERERVRETESVRQGQRGNIARDFC